MAPNDTTSLSLTGSAGLLYAGGFRQVSRVYGKQSTGVTALDDVSVAFAAGSFTAGATGALDSKAARVVLNMLRAMVDERDQSIVMVTHDPIAASSADEVMFLSDGRIIDRLTQPSERNVAAVSDIVGVQVRATPWSLFAAVTLTATVLVLVTSVLTTVAATRQPPVTLAGARQ